MGKKFADYGLSKNSAKKNISKNSGYRTNNSRFNSNYTNNSFGNKEPFAPYNFIKINDNVVMPPIGESVTEYKTQKEVRGAYCSFISKSEKYSGYFDIMLENLTPLYIAGSEMFFSDGKNICIPGSSLRGCVKNIIKIITNGSMKTGQDADVTDKTLYFRSFASKYTKFKDLYNNYMMSKDDKYSKIISQAGFLAVKKFKGEKVYYICPAKYNAMKLKGKTVVDAKGNESFEAAPGELERRIEWTDDWVDVYTGKILGKKHFYRISAPDWKNLLPVSPKLIQSYEDDKNRDKNNNLLNESRKDKQSGKSNLKILKGAEQFDIIMPCFYVADETEVISFGAGPYYRIPYKKSIGDHIPQHIKTDKVDFAAAVFGSKENWGSRIIFEDCYLKDESVQPKVIDKPKPIQLLGPNPTSFQNYLEPKDGEAQHWDTENVNIRGYKLYWHRACEYPSPQGVSGNTVKHIRPVKENTVFTGRIRFENLDGIELGALAKVLVLGEAENSAYKLGMGKPLGLGSVRITSKLIIKDLSYYKSLFDNESFRSGLKEVPKENFVKKFEEYMAKKLQGISYKLYQERMKELALIMSLEHKSKADWQKKTAYMGLEKENRSLMNSRVPLPDISTVVGNKK